MLFGEPVPSSNRRPNPPLIYGTATGDRGDFEFFPLNAVRWLTVRRGKSPRS